MDNEFRDRTREEIQHKLEAMHPAFQVWYVPGIGNVTWCARPWGAPIASHNAPSPRELHADLTEAEQEAQDQP